MDGKEESWLTDIYYSKAKPNRFRLNDFQEGEEEENIKEMEELRLKPRSDRTLHTA